jgi:polysaccharide deacetylase family protein (PEP-CTERM system associated)
LSALSIAAAGLLPTGQPEDDQKVSTGGGNVAFGAIRSTKDILMSDLSGKCIFSIDVEDWFHILDVAAAPPLSRWDEMPSRIERDFMRLLEVFAGASVRTTCFFLGWVAKRFPHLVRQAGSLGHEIASHGYAHRLVFEMTPGEFVHDAMHSRLILEDVSGQRVEGYRSAGFSVTNRTHWFFEELLNSGYVYDSSLFPASRGHGGIANAPRLPYVINTRSGSLVEFPISVSDVCGRPMCFFGGGYLRLFPYRVIECMARRVAAEGRPVIFYVHPREIDPAHPRLPMPLHRRFKSYVGLQTTERKIRRLIDTFPMVTFREYLASSNLASSPGVDIPVEGVAT